MTAIDFVRFSSEVSANGTEIEQADDAHDNNILVACLKRDRVQLYNQRGLDSAREEDIRIFYSFDCNLKSGAFVRSLDNPSLDICLDIQSRVTLAHGCPVRVTRPVVAFCGKACLTIPKNSFGTFLHAMFDEKDILKSTAKVKFHIQNKDWVAEVAYAMEEFDLSDLDTVHFKSFFEDFGRRHHMPLELAYSVTMTSLQGREFDILIFDLKDIGIWIRHVLYMGLTRVRSSKGIRCLNIPHSGSLFNKNDHEIVELYQRFEAISEHQRSSESNRNENFLTLDFVDLLEKFKVYYFLFI